MVPAPKDLNRCFKDSSRTLMKKSRDLTTKTGARIAIYMERGSERVLFRTHEDVMPQWDALGADQITAAGLPTSPDFTEFRYSSSTEMSKSPSASNLSSLGAAKPLHTTSLSSPPTLDSFSIPGLEELQLTALRDTVAVTPPASEPAMVQSSPAGSPSVVDKRQRPVSDPGRRSPSMKPRKRAKTKSWFQ